MKLQRFASAVNIFKIIPRKSSSFAEKKFFFHNQSPITEVSFDISNSFFSLFNLFYSSTHLQRKNSLFIMQAGKKKLKKIMYIKRVKQVFVEFILELCFFFRFGRIVSIYYKYLDS